MAGNTLPHRRAVGPRPRVAAALLLVLAAGLLPGGEGRYGPLPEESPEMAAAARSARAGDLEGAYAALRRCLDATPRDPRPYRELVDLALRLRDPLRAERELNERAAADPANASPHYARGKLRYHRGDLAGARLEASEALRLDPGHGYARLLLGLVEYTQGHPAAALRAWRRARRDLIREGDLPGEILARNNLAMVHVDLQEYDRAREEYERALRLQRSIGNTEGERLALSNLGLTLNNMGRYDEAVPLLREAHALSRWLSDPAGECHVLEYLCDAYQKLGAYAEALGFADSLIALARRSRDPVSETAGLLGEATAQHDLGRPLAALRAAERGLCLAESLGHPRYAGAFLLTLGETEALLGRLDPARSAFARCDSVSRAAGVGVNAAIAQARLCQTAWQAGDTARARSLGAEALAFSTRIAYEEGQATAAGLLAELALARADLEEARRLADQSCELARRSGRRVDLARALARRSRIRLDSEDPSGALSEAREGRRLARSIGSPEAEVICALAEGDALRFRDRESALEAYRAAAALVESVRGTLRLDEFKAGYLRDRREPYYEAAELLVELGRPLEAFRMSERSRARAFREYLESGPAEAVKASAPSEASETILPRGLAPDEAFLEYFLGTRGSLCFVAGPGGFEAVRLDINAAEVATSVDTLRRSLRAPRSLATLPFDAKTAGRLRERLLDPVRPLCAEASRLYVVPDGPLHYLPLEMLPEAAEAQGAPPGAPSDALPVVPAATVAGALHAAFRDRRFVGDGAAIVYLPAASLLRRGSDGHLDAKLLRRGGLVALGGAEADLPHAAQEVERLGDLFLQGITRAGSAATEEAFRVSAPNASVLHLSAHGVVDGDAPLYSYLRLAGDPAHPEDGRLHAHEVMDLRLQCDLVTLSACETGLGRLYAGEGVFGLARAFLLAGAGQVVVSLWRVNDEATTRLMEVFYRRLSAGSPPAEALRQAKWTLREETILTEGGRRISLAHPFFWAPFVLVEGGGVAGEVTPRR